MKITNILSLAALLALSLITANVTVAQTTQSVPQYKPAPENGGQVTPGIPARPPKMIIGQPQQGVPQAPSVPYQTLTYPQQPQTQVRPQVVPPVQNQRQNPFYFGMDLQLVRAYDGPTLRVTRVTPGGPAQRAGLEVGDEIRTVNGYGFQQATNSYHGVYLMNQFTAINASAPAAAAPAQASPSVQVAPSPSQGPPVARMIVRNVRNGQNVQLSVYPQFRNSILPAPAPAAPAVRSSGNGR